MRFSLARPVRVQNQEGLLMNILLTNDDGITAPGVWAAAEALVPFGAVTIVAPATNYSGFGAALPITRTFSYTPYHRGDDHPAGVTAYALSGTPAACAQAGLSEVLGGGPFDLLVSGINLGANLGRDLFYSGTVGAALTAHLLGVPAIAASLAAGTAGVPHWTSAAWALAEVVRLWQSNPEPSPVVFNVNVPNLPVTSISGTLITSFTRDCCLSKYRFVADPHADHRIAVVRQESDYQPEVWSDAWAVGLGYVAITPFKAIPDLLSPTERDIPSQLVPLPVLSTPKGVE